MPTASAAVVRDVHVAGRTHASRRSRSATPCCASSRRRLPIAARASARRSISVSRPSDASAHSRRRRCLTLAVRRRRRRGRTSTAALGRAAAARAWRSLFFYPLSLIARAGLHRRRRARSTRRSSLPVLHSRAVPRTRCSTRSRSRSPPTAGCLVLGLRRWRWSWPSCRFPGATFVARLIDTFIALPTFLVTLAFTFIYGSAGMLNGALMQARSACSRRRSIFSIRPGASSSPK